MNEYQTIGLDGEVRNTEPNTISNGGKNHTDKRQDIEAKNVSKWTVNIKKLNKIKS